MIYETEEDGDEITQDLWQEACWIVISSYFDEKRPRTTTARLVWRGYSDVRTKDNGGMPQIDLQAEVQHTLGIVETPEGGKKFRNLKILYKFENFNQLILQYFKEYFKE